MIRNPKDRRKSLYLCQCTKKSFKNGSIRKNRKPNTDTKSRIVRFVGWLHLFERLMFMQSMIWSHKVGLLHPNSKGWYSANFVLIQSRLSQRGVPGCTWKVNIFKLWLICSSCENSRQQCLFLSRFAQHPKFKHVVWHLTSVTAFLPSPWPRPLSPWPEPWSPWPSSSSRSCAAWSACCSCCCCCCCWPSCWGLQATMQSASCSSGPYSHGRWNLESSALGSPAPPSFPSLDLTEARIRSLPMPGTNYGRGASSPAVAGISEALGGAPDKPWLPQVGTRWRVAECKKAGWLAGRCQANPTWGHRRRGRGLEFNQNKADGGEKPWPWPREGPLLLETIIGGTLTLSRSWCQATQLRRRFYYYDN